MNTQNGSQTHLSTGRTWPVYEEEAYDVQILGTVSLEVVEAFKAELLALCTRYGVTPKVRRVMNQFLSPEDQAEKNALDEEAIKQYYRHGFAN